MAASDSEHGSLLIIITVYPDMCPNTNKPQTSKPMDEWNKANNELLPLRVRNGLLETTVFVECVSKSDGAFFCSMFDTFLAVQTKKLCRMEINFMDNMKCPSDKQGARSVSVMTVSV